MTNIDNNDNLVKRLGKLVPVYIVALLSAVAAFLDVFYNIDPVQAQIALIVLIGVGIGLTWYIESTQMTVTNKVQLIIAMFNGALWLFLVNIRFFNFNQLVSLWIQFLIALWTFVIGLIYR